MTAFYGRDDVQFFWAKWGGHRALGRVSTALREAGGRLKLCEILLRGDSYGECWARALWEEVSWTSVQLLGQALIRHLGRRAAPEGGLFHRQRPSRRAPQWETRLRGDDNLREQICARSN